MSCKKIKSISDLSVPRHCWQSISNMRPSCTTVLTLDWFGGFVKPWSDAVITWNLRKHASERFPRFSSFIILCDVERCACGHLRSYRFCKGSEFWSRWPDVIVSVRWPTHSDPTLWLEGAKRQVAVKSWNSLSACFYGRVSSIQHKQFCRPKIFLL